MQPIRSLSIPLITGLLTGSLVFWAFPEEVSSWRGFAIVSGWIGCGLLLASLLFMVREPYLADWLGGLDRMYAWHHRLGVAAYLVLLAHPLGLAADGWRESPVLAWPMISPWDAGWPTWLGWASLLSMMLGLLVALMPRLPYARWRLLHHLLTAAIIFGCAHLFLLGLDYALLGAPLLALGFMVWRFLRADYGLAARPYLVAEVGRPGKDVVEILLRPLAQAIDACPGQFVAAAFFDGPHFSGCREYHPFTLSNFAPGGGISLSVKALGDCTRRLQSVERGVAVRLQGPFGNFLADPPPGPSLWIAGGIGITPFLAALRSGRSDHPVRLVYFYRNPAEAAYLDELRRLEEENSALSLQAVSSEEGPPDLSAILPDGAELAGRECYLCGPPGLVAKAADILRGRGVKPERIHFEGFDFR